MGLELSFYFHQNHTSHLWIPDQRVAIRGRPQTRHDTRANLWPHLLSNTNPVNPLQVFSSALLPYYIKSIKTADLLISIRPESINCLLSTALALCPKQVYGLMLPDNHRPPVKDRDAQVSYQHLVASELCSPASWKDHEGLLTKILTLWMEMQQQQEEQAAAHTVDLLSLTLIVITFIWAFPQWCCDISRCSFISPHNDLVIVLYLIGGVAAMMPAATLLLQCDNCVTIKTITEGHKRAILQC